MVQNYWTNWNFEVRRYEMKMHWNILKPHSIVWSSCLQAKMRETIELKIERHWISWKSQFSMKYSQIGYLIEPKEHIGENSLPLGLTFAHSAKVPSSWEYCSIQLCIVWKLINSCHLCYYLTETSSYTHSEWSEWVFVINIVNKKTLHLEWSERCWHYW